MTDPLTPEGEANLREDWAMGLTTPNESALLATLDAERARPAIDVEADIKRRLDEAHALGYREGYRAAIAALERSRP